MKDNPKNKLIVSSVLMTAAIASVMFLYTRVGDSYKKAKLDYAKLLSESEILDITIANTEKTNILLSGISDIQQTMPSILPPEKVQSDIVAQILSNGESTGIFIESINFPTSEGDNFELSQTEPLEGVSGVNKLPININFTSTFDQMILFIESLEKNRRISQIENITINPSGIDEDGNPTGSLSISILMNLYVRK